MRLFKESCGTIPERKEAKVIWAEVILREDPIKKAVL